MCVLEMWSAVLGAVESAEQKALHSGQLCGQGLGVGAFLQIVAQEGPDVTKRVFKEAQFRTEVHQSWKILISD